MAVTTAKGYQYPVGADTVTTYPVLNQANVLLFDARPGVSSVTTTVRNAYSGIDLWDGRIIWNTTNLRLEKYDIGTTSWVPAFTLNPATSSAGPAAFNDSPITGTSLLYSRQDHNHGLPSVASLATVSALSSETSRATSAESVNAAAVVTEAAARVAADALLLPKLNGVLTSVFESVNITGVALAATQEIDVTTNSTLMLVTANAANNFILNIRSTATVQLNTLMAVGTSITVTVLVTQGGTPYYCTNIQIDGTTQTVHWQGGTAPTAGFASGIDAYTVQITKTASATYTVLASLTQF